jgi:quercetin dioxygenase-like cupin family protein
VLARVVLTVARIGWRGKILEAAAISTIRLVAPGAEGNTLDEYLRERSLAGVGAMYISMNGRIVIAASAAMWALATPATRAQAAPVDAELQWIPAPSILPTGARIAVVSGDPFKPGEFTIEFDMPDTYKLPPHTNPSREHVLVKSGALRAGIGRKIDLKQSVVLAAGDTASVPAGVPHWSIAQGETHLVVTEEMGPYGIAYMSVRDEPGSHAFPNGY